MRKYSCLLFDLDDTLLDFHGDEAKSLLKVLENYGLPHTDDVLTLYREIQLFPAINLGEKITAKTIITQKFAQLLKMLEVKENIDIITDEYFQMMAKCHKVKSGAIKTLKYLKEKGYMLYITTNGYPDFQYKRIRASRMFNFFDGFFISEEIGLYKPARSFYDYVLSRIHISDRSKVLIIGDAPSADIFGGNNSQIDTCWLNDKGMKCKYPHKFEIKKITDLINIL